MVIRTGQQKGFTIVELLIVIVVIAILAAITIVAYNGIQQRARDTKRKDDVTAVAKLVQMYNVDHGPLFSGSGCGSGGAGSGFLNYTYSGYTPIMDCLKTGTNTTANIEDDSKSCSGDTCHAYMIYTCNLSGQTVTYVYANLQGGTHADGQTDGTCAASWDTGYGMNYYVKVVDS